MRVKVKFTNNKKLTKKFCPFLKLIISRSKWARRFCYNYFTTAHTNGHFKYKCSYTGRSGVSSDFESNSRFVDSQHAPRSGRRRNQVWTGITVRGQRCGPFACKCQFDVLIVMLIYHDLQIQLLPKTDTFKTYDDLHKHLTPLRQTKINSVYYWLFC